MGVGEKRREGLYGDKKWRGEGEKDKVIKVRRPLMDPTSWVVFQKYDQDSLSL